MGWKLYPSSDCPNDDLDPSGSPAGTVCHQCGTPEDCRTCCESTPGCGGFNFCSQFRSFGITKKTDCKSKIKESEGCSLYLKDGPVVPTSPPTPPPPTPPLPPFTGNNWAVIVAGSKTFGNYRHQADACHAYQILKKNGIPESNIILMVPTKMPFFVLFCFVLF
jgi:hypothetical protein